MDVSISCPLPDTSSFTPDYEYTIGDSDLNVILPQGVQESSGGTQLTHCQSDLIYSLSEQLDWLNDVIGIGWVKIESGHMRTNLSGLIRETAKQAAGNYNLVIEA